MQCRHPPPFRAERNLCGARELALRNACRVPPSRPRRPARLRSDRLRSATGRRPSQPWHRTRARRHAAAPSTAGRDDDRVRRPGTRRRVVAGARHREQLSGHEQLRTVISFLVSVPVLSEQITDVLPSVSTTGRRRTSALRLTMRRTPMASEIVTTAGSASGTTATASAMPKMNMSSTGKPAPEPEANDQRHDDKRRLPKRSTQLVEVLLQWRSAGLDRLDQP